MCTQFRLKITFIRDAEHAITMKKNRNIKSNVCVFCSKTDWSNLCYYFEQHNIICTRSISTKRTKCTCGTILNVGRVLRKSFCLRSSQISDVLFFDTFEGVISRCLPVYTHGVCKHRSLPSAISVLSNRKLQFRYDDRQTIACGNEKKETPNNLAPRLSLACNGKRARVSAQNAITKNYRSHFIMADKPVVCLIVFRKTWNPD